MNDAWTFRYDRPSSPATIRAALGWSHAGLLYIGTPLPPQLERHLGELLGGVRARAGRARRPGARRPPT